MYKFDKYTSRQVNCGDKFTVNSSNHEGVVDEFTSRQVNCSDKPQLTSVLMSGSLRVNGFTSRPVNCCDKPQLTLAIIILN